MKTHLLVVKLYICFSNVATFFFNVLCLLLIMLSINCPFITEWYIWFHSLNRRTNDFWTI